MARPRSQWLPSQTTPRTGANLDLYNLYSCSQSLSVQLQLVGQFPCAIPVSCRCQHQEETIDYSGESPLQRVDSFDGLAKLDAVAKEWRDWCDENALQGLRESRPRLLAS